MTVHSACSGSIALFPGSSPPALFPGSSPPALFPGSSPPALFQAPPPQPCSQAPPQLFVAYCMTKSWGGAWERGVYIRHKVSAPSQHVKTVHDVVFQRLPLHSQALGLLLDGCPAGDTRIRGELCSQRLQTLVLYIHCLQLVCIGLEGGGGGGGEGEEREGRGRWVRE